MIRRDYLVRLVQELTQAVARIFFLKRSQEYARGLQELEQVLSRFWKLTPEQISSLSLEEWIELCRKEEGAMGEKLTALADVFLERTDLFSKEGNIAESQRSGAISLGLYLEAVSIPETIVSVDLLGRIQQLIEQSSDAQLAGDVLQRLARYYEARGMLDKAEDTLFDWADTGDKKAVEEGLAFYERLSAKTDQELEQGGLPRQEVSDGQRELRTR